jgi:hypothetical protein
MASVFLLLRFNPEVGISIPARRVSSQQNDVISYAVSLWTIESSAAMGAKSRSSYAENWLVVHLVKGEVNE